MELGARSLELGAWSLELGAWRVELKFGRKVKMRETKRGCGNILRINGRERESWEGRVSVFCLKKMDWDLILEFVEFVNLSFS